MELDTHHTSMLNVRRKSSKSNVNCCVYGCRSVNKKNPELLFHQFPSSGQTVVYVDEFGNKRTTERRKLWIIKIKMGKAVSKHMRVCSKHFVDDDYMTPNEDSYAKRYLKKTAVPSQHLPSASYNSLNDIKKQQREKRASRLMERRKKANVENCSVSETATRVLSPEVLMELQDNTFNEGLLGPSHGNNKQFHDIGVQTIDTCFCECHSKVTPISNDDKSVQVDTKWLTFSDYIRTDKALRILTGLHSMTLLLLLVELFSSVCKISRKLSVKDRILMVFLKLKLDLTYSALSVLFGGMSLTTCKSIFHETVEVLAQVLEIYIYLPSKENILQNLPICFDKYRKVRIVLDCTEVRVQSPKKICCRLKLYSHYKKSYTLKFMTGVTPAGLISYISPSYGGRASDKRIFEQSKLIEQLEPYVDHIMVDKGFLIDSLCDSYGIKLIRPPFLRKKKQFNRAEAAENRNIAAARVHVERVNARIKNFRIFRNTFPIHLVEIVDEIFLIVCAVINLSSPIFKDNRFL